MKYHNKRFRSRFALNDKYEYRITWNGKEYLVDEHFPFSEDQVELSFARGDWIPITNNRVKRMCTDV